MTLYCGGRKGGHEVKGGFAMVYRLSVVDGKILSPDHRIKSGDNQPNCALCDECWARTPASDYMTETQALAARGDHDHVFAYCPAGSGDTAFGTKEWSSIETKNPVVFLSPETVARYVTLDAVITDMHERQVAFAARQELCDAKKCDCAQQKRKEHEKGDHGLHAGTLVRWKDKSLWSEDSPDHQWLEGCVVRHEHPPHANWHFVKTSDGRRFNLYEVYEIKARTKGTITFGGCLGLAIRDRSKLDRAKAVAAFRVLWHDAAERVLDAIPKDGAETGATFTGTAEEYGVFEKLVAGSGVDVDLTLRPPTKNELEMLRSIHV